MSLTRKMLKAMGIEEEKIDQIIEAHSETVDGLKADIEKYKADAKALPGVQKQLEQAQADLETAKNDGWKDKHDKVKKELDDLKSGIEAEKAASAKEKAVRAFYESKNITGDNLELAMRGSRDEIAALEMDGDKIKDTKAIDDLVSGTFSRLVSSTRLAGADTHHPPVNNGGSYSSKDEIMKIKDPTERQNAIAANINLFRKE